MSDDEPSENLELLDTEPPEDSAAGENDGSSVGLAAILEAMLFASPHPLAVKDLRAALRSAADFAREDEMIFAHQFAEAKPAEIEGALHELARYYEESDRAYRLKETVSGFQLVSLPEYALWVRQLFPELRPARLSAAALETLAIVAYRQPVTKADLETVRGVKADGVLQTLLDRGLVKIGGRADQPGRPLLYETTTHFLEHFGLKNLNELPNSIELRKLMDQANAAKENDEVSGEPSTEAEESAGEEASTAEMIEGDAAAREPAEVEDKTQGEEEAHAADKEVR